MQPNNEPTVTGFSSQIFSPAMAPQTPLQAPPQQPTGFTGLPPVIKTGHKFGKKSLIALIVAVVVVLGGLVAYAYYAGIGPFNNPPYNENSLASSIFGGIGKISMASYALNINVVSEPKESDATPFNVAVPVDANKIAAYGRDQDRVRDIKNILERHF